MGIHGSDQHIPNIRFEKQYTYIHTTMSSRNNTEYASVISNCSDKHLIQIKEQKKNPSAPINSTKQKQKKQ